MQPDEIMAGFDQLFNEVRQFLEMEEDIEGDPPLHDLKPRLDKLCREVLMLPLDQSFELRARMRELTLALAEVSKMMQLVMDAQANEKVESGTL